MFTAPVIAAVRHKHHSVEGEPSGSQRQKIGIFNHPPEFKGKTLNNRCYLCEEKLFTGYVWVIYLVWILIVVNTTIND